MLEARETVNTAVASAFGRGLCSVGEAEHGHGTHRFFTSFLSTECENKKSWARVFLFCARSRKTEHRIRCTSLTSVNAELQRNQAGRNAPRGPMARKRMTACPQGGRPLTGVEPGVLLAAQPCQDAPAVVLLLPLLLLQLLHERFAPVTLLLALAGHLHQDRPATPSEGSSCEWDCRRRT